MRRLHYWWSLFVAGALLGLLGPPILLFAWLVNKHDLVYPWALFGARCLVAPEWRQREVSADLSCWIRNRLTSLSPIIVHISTRPRCLSTRAGESDCLPKKEFLKVPVLGVGMGFVNVMAIDRTNRESAIRTTEAAAQAYSVRCLVWSFCRRDAGEAG